MFSIWRRIPYPLVSRILRQEFPRISSCHTLCKNDVNLTSTSVNLQPFIISYKQARSKSKKRQYDSDDDEEHVEEDSTLSRDSKVVKFSTTSLRTDVMLKSALGVARNKIEQVFYESKIRLNGKKVMKKSASIRIGDEIDVIKSVSPKNPDHLYVSRVEIINLEPKEENISVTARRFKNLLIENYEQDPYKGSAENDEN